VGGQTKAGRPRDLAEIASAISKGQMNMQQVMESAPDVYAMYHKGLESLAVQMFPDRDPSVAPEVLWYYGGIGTGKSRKAWEENPFLGVRVISSLILWVGGLGYCVGVRCAARRSDCNHQ
jgi:hypothetical protein